jgi:dTDP-4-dehydrorhamnose 3,5-epimerase
MKMHIRTVGTPIEGVLVVENEAFQDERGFFVEIYRKDLFRRVGLPDTFVQLNRSRSRRNVLRGLHFQWDPPVGKLMRVAEGKAFLVAVDIRKGSPTLGKWVGVELEAGDHKQIWAPAGFARGFAVLSDWAEIEYLCTGLYNPASESNIRWNDPHIGIDWPVSDPVLSARDEKAQSFSQWIDSPESELFQFLP